jgi:hypothetical protein
MRKIILAVALIAATLSAKAWHINCDKGVLLAAAQNYNPETLKLMQRYVGEDLSKPAQYLQSVRKEGRLLESKDWHTLHLNADLKPAAADDNDAYVQIEKALVVLRNHQQHGEKEVRLALFTVMNLVIEMHHISNVAIEGVANSGTDFQYTSSKGTANGRPARLTPASWKALWTTRYVYQHSGYTPAMWANELDVMFADKKAQYSAGTLVDWCHDIGQDTKKVHGILEANEGKFLHATIQAHEELHMSCMGRAAYRLAALLNENFK